MNCHFAKNIINNPDFLVTSSVSEKLHNVDKLLQSKVHCLYYRT